MELPKTNSIYPMDTLIRETITSKSIISTFISRKSTIGTLLHGVTQFGLSFLKTTNGDLTTHRAFLKQIFFLPHRRFLYWKGNKNLGVCRKRLYLLSMEWWSRGGSRKELKKALFCSAIVVSVCFVFFATMATGWLKGAVKPVKAMSSKDSLLIIGSVKGGPPPEKTIILASLIAPKLVWYSSMLVCLSIGVAGFPPRWVHVAQLESTHWLHSTCAVISQISNRGRAL